MKIRRPPTVLIIIIAIVAWIVFMRWQHPHNDAKPIIIETKH